MQINIFLKSTFKELEKQIQATKKRARDRERKRKRSFRKQNNLRSSPTATDAPPHPNFMQPLTSPTLWNVGKSYGVAAAPQMII